MTIGFGMRQPVLNKPHNKWRQKRFSKRIPKKAESKWWIDAYYTEGGIAPPITVGTLGPWSFTNNTGTKTYNTATGFNGAEITYSLVSPPTGVTINSSTGVITANSAVTVAGSSTLTVQAANSAGFATQTIALTIAIAAPIAVGTLSDWSVATNTGVQTRATATGFAGSSLTYSLPTGFAGVSINTSTGVLSFDTTAAAVTSHAMVVRATNSSGSVDQAINLVVASGLTAPTLVGTIGPWNVGQYTGNQTFNAAAGFAGASIVYTLQTGSTGVTIDSATGVVTVNTATSGSGTKSLVVRATNGAGSADQPLSLVIAVLAAPATVGTIGPWNEGQNTGSKTFDASVGFTGSSIVYSLVSPPTGVTISSGTGIVTVNTATVGVGTKSLTVRATNGAGSADQPLSLIVAQQYLASGGTRTEVNISGTNYVVHTLTASGTLDVLVAGNFDLLYCASGGAGGAGPSGSTLGGSGGAGGFKIRTAVALAVGSYPITIGEPGLGVIASDNIAGPNGGNLVAFGDTVLGGGGGGNGNSATGPTIVGQDGGCGGGGSVRTGVGNAGGTGAAGQGFAGGASYGSVTVGDRAGGGGGGAGGVGGAATITKGGDGGIGVTSNFDGVSRVYSPGASGNCAVSGVPGTAAPGGATGSNGTNAVIAPTAPGAGGYGVRFSTSGAGLKGVFKLRYVKP